MDPLMEKIKSLGCSTTKKIQMAYILYQHLADVKLKYNVQCKYNAELDLIYLKCQESTTSPDDIFVPQSTSDLISLQDIYTMQSVLESSRITLAIMESDSTIVYYEFAEGLQSLDLNADAVKHKNSKKSHVREKLYSNLRKIYSEQSKSKQNNKEEG